MRRINPFAPIGFEDNWLGGGAGGAGLGSGAELGESGYQGRTADESSPGWIPNPQAFKPFNTYIGVDPYTGIPIMESSTAPETTDSEAMLRLGPLIYEPNTESFNAPETTADSEAMRLDPWIYQGGEPNMDPFNAPELAYSRAALAFAIDESVIDSVLSIPGDLPSGTGEGTFDGETLVIIMHPLDDDVPKPPSEPPTSTRDSAFTESPTQSAVPSQTGSGGLAESAKSGRGPSIPDRDDRSTQVTAKNVALGTAHIRIPATSGAYFTPNGVRKTVVNAANSTLIASLDPVGYRHVLKFAGVDVEGLFHINVGDDDDDYSETVGGAAVLISSLILGSVGGATGRALTAADLGLAETDAVVHGTIRVAGNRAIVKVDYLGSVNKEIGLRSLGIIAKLEEVARAAGASALRIETSPVLNPKVYRALRLARLQPRSNGTFFYQRSLKR